MSEKIYQLDIKNFLLYYIMTEKSYVDIAAEIFPSMNEDELFCKYLYHETYNNMYYLNDNEYREWYHKHVIENRPFMDRVFILRDSGAIKLFEDIINSPNFFSYVILHLREFEPLRKTIDTINRIKWSSWYYIPSDVARTFTENIIIPKEYDNIHEYNINNYRDLSKFLEDNPIKINFNIGLNKYYEARRQFNQVRREMKSYLRGDFQLEEKYQRELYSRFNYLENKFEEMKRYLRNDFQKKKSKIIFSIRSF